MVEDIIGITESWANKDIADAELGLPGYVMLRSDRIVKREGELFCILQNILRLTK